MRQLPLPQQRRVRVIGALKDLLMRTTFYISILNFLMLAVTAYYTTVRYFLPFPFWLFFLCLLLIVGIAMLIEYAIVMPSQISFINWQIYTHNNPIRRDLEEIKSELDEIKSKLK